MTPDPPAHPPGLGDAEGESTGVPRGRFRWWYTVRYRWPRDPPTPQDLADMRRTYAVATPPAFLIAPALALLASATTPIPWTAVGPGIAAGTIAGALTGLATWRWMEWDWRRRQP